MSSGASSDVTVFIVDDSSYMRAVISDIIAAADGLRCVGWAANPMEARQKIKDTNPDVLTLDIEMPGMNGLDFLQKIMRLRPMPVIMVSSLTRGGADATIRALSSGAVDCIAKPAGAADMTAFRQDVTDKIRAAGAADIPRSSFSPSAPAVAPVYTASSAIDMIAVGSSTGGVEALETLFPALDATLPPVIVVQHMPAMFTASLAARLNMLCAATVKEGEDGDILQRGHIYVAPGGMQCRVAAEGAVYCLRVSDTERVSGHCPSVDALFHSVADNAKQNAVGVILTGMGNDGAQGLMRMRRAGCATLGQDEATSLIYGMPRAAYDAGAVVQQLPLDRIAAAVRQTCRG